MSDKNIDKGVEELHEHTPATAAPGLPPTDDQSTGRGEGVGTLKEVEGLSQAQIVRQRFLRHKGAVAGMATVAIIILLSTLTMGAFGIPGLWKYQDPRASHPLVNDGAPTLRMPWDAGGFNIGEHPFGQDNLGSDNFAAVMAGIQTSLTVIILIGVIAAAIGVTIGALSGYFRSWVDDVLMRLTDLFITLPTIVVGAVLGKLISTLPMKLGLSAQDTEVIRNNMPVLLGIALGLISWTGLARLTRSEFLRLRELEFVDAARVCGASNSRIIGRHILPNAVGVVLVNLTLLMSAAVVLESALSFLNFGIQPPTISLGYLISNYQPEFATRPWLFWWPGVFIISLALSINLIGDGLRDAFDPRTKRVPSIRQMDKAEKLDADIAAQAAATSSEAKK